MRTATRREATGWEIQKGGDGYIPKEKTKSRVKQRDVTSFLRINSGRVTMSRIQNERIAGETLRDLVSRSAIVLASEPREPCMPTSINCTGYARNARAICVHSTEIPLSAYSRSYFSFPTRVERASGQSLATTFIFDW